APVKDFFQFLAWSPDGRQLAYSIASQKDALGEIDLFDLARKKARPLAVFNDKLPVELKWLQGNTYGVFASRSEFRAGANRIGFISSRTIPGPNQGHKSLCHAYGFGGRQDVGHRPSEESA